mmetsp:Transcript_79051/g.142607  ORF Transcript_79051/g.142607 Transcript_79051/m.142607 type:complete len:367 (+) Transcript_79051:98-1198(+)
MADLQLQLKTLTEAVLRQAEQSAAVSQQLQEQGKLLNSTLQAVQALHIQVNSLRQKLSSGSGPNFKSQAPENNSGDQPLFSRENSGDRPTVTPTDGQSCGSSVSSACGDDQIFIGSERVELGAAGAKVLHSTEAFNRSAPGLTLQPSVSAVGSFQRVSSEEEVKQPQPQEKQLQEKQQAQQMHQYLQQQIAQQMLQHQLSQQLPSQPSFSSPQPRLARAPSGRGEQSSASVEASTEEFFALMRAGSEEAIISALKGISAQVLNSTDGQRLTALHYAAQYGSVNIVCHIIARPDFQALKAGDSRGNTAIHIATQKGHSEMCRILLALDPLAAVVPNSAGLTPAQMAVELADATVCSVFKQNWDRRRA